MKKYLAIIVAAFALLFIAGNSQAQPVYGYVTLLSSSGLTNGVVSPTWSTQVIDVRKQNETTLAVTGSASVTEANVVTISYAVSVDGVNYEYNNARSLVVTCSAVGGGAKTVCTNIPTMGFGYIKIVGLTNAASAGGLTGLTMTASLKLVNGK